MTNHEDNLRRFKELPQSVRIDFCLERAVSEAIHERDRELAYLRKISVQVSVGSE